MWVTSSLSTALTPTAVALGNFDGVHRGHRRVIEPVLAQSHSGPESLKVTVVTFDPHPREFFTGQTRPLITPLPEKVLQLKRLGIEQLVLLPFNQELSDLSPREFVEQVLLEQLQARHISVGSDFCFGYQRSGTAADLQKLAGEFGIQVTIVPLQLIQGERISSSAIREALDQGDLKRVNRLLGRPYSLTGEVVKGQQLGRTLGFPTANLKVSEEKLVPRSGVYCVRVSVSDSREPEANPSPPTSPNLLPGVMNIGYRPTIEGVGRTIEIHLLDWGGDLYGQTLTVLMEEFLRPEQKFASLEDLKAQIQVDCETARMILMATT
ncbi:MAG: bifunctional riboflavin kinase/FAD synthetase [Leptolyngbyaceae cyanobacterium bins.59]|nr:bifunctional riboflavin kinase/FAD synthetase [Leptolyngbyaceae cyanobacterium bins.59]